MGTPYFDLNALIYGQDYSDPLGLNKFLEEERRKKEEEEKQFNLYRFLGMEGPDTPSLMTAFNEAIGIPLGLAKKPVDILASKMSGLKETVPAEELLTNALFPERGPGDIERTTKPSMDFPLGSPKTESDLVVEEAANEIARRGVGTIGGFGLNPATWMMGAPGIAGKAVTGAFLPGISESLGTSLGTGISKVESGDIPGAAGEFTQSLLDTLFLGGMTKHLGRMEPKAATSEIRQSEPVSEVSDILYATALPRIEKAPKEVRDFLYETSERYRDLTDQLAAFERDRKGWGGLPQGFEKLLKTQEIEVKKELTQLENEALTTEPLTQNLPTKIPQVPLTPETGDIYSDARRNVRGFAEAAVRQLQESINKEGDLGVFAEPGTRADVMNARVSSVDPITDFTDKSIARFYGTPGLSEQALARKGVLDIVPYLKRSSLLELNPVSLREHSRNPVDFVHNLVDTIAHELAHGRSGQHPDLEAWGKRRSEPGKLGDVPPEYQTMYDTEFRLQNQKDILKQKLYETPAIKGLLETVNIPDSPIARTFHRLSTMYMAPGVERVGFGAQDIPKAQGLPEKVVSEPANILRKILQETKLTKFNKSTLVEELKAKGIDVPEEIKSSLPELLGELKDRGWINEKIGGTYSLLIEPPRKTSVEAEKTAPPTSDIMTQMQATLENLPPKKAPAEKVEDTATKVALSTMSNESLARLNRTIPKDEGPGRRDLDAEILRRAEAGEIGIPTTPDQKVSAKLTIQEIDEVQRILATAVKKGKGKKAELPEELRLAREAAVKALGSERPAKARSKAKPPEGIATEEVSEGSKPKPEPYEVTLSDGSAHTIRATSPEEATGKVQEILDEYGSTKTVDKVEKKLSSIEKAAKYEIEPVRIGMEEVTDIETGARKAKVEETKLGKEEEKLRKAQTKEKFQKKTFKVNLSNGRIATVKARNENIARQMVADRIKRTKSNVTIESVAEKQSSIDEAIQGAARKLEETGWLQSPVAQILNSIKSIAFGGDIGHLLRQGKQMNADLLFSKHAKKVLDQLPVIFKSAKSEEFFKDFHDKLYADPLIKTMVDNFGLDMPGLGKHFKEEVFHGAGLAEKIPIVGKYYAKPSERAYTAGLNYLRAAEARKFAEKLEKRGFTPENAPEKYRSLARALNIISQRGDFGPAYQKVFSDLSTIYGAPRAKAGRLQNAIELFRGGTSGDIVRTTAAKTLGFNLALFGLLKTVTGAQFIDDPERSDAGKIRIGDNITVDPWMGLGVTARTVAKLITGKRASPYTGKTYPVSPGEALQDEFLGGIAPGIKLAWEAMSGKDIRGYQVNRWKSLLNVAPLTAKSLAELGSAGGDIEDMLLLSLLQIGGEGVDVFDYEKAREEERQLKLERGIPVGKKKKKVTFNF